MNWARRTALIATICLMVFTAIPLEVASAAPGWQPLYYDLLLRQQSQARARRSVALIDFEGDGVPELVQLAALGSGTRTCRLSVYQIQSGTVSEMASSGAFNLPSQAIAGVRTVAFGLRAKGSSPCLAVQIKSVSGGATVLTRLAFVKEGASPKLSTVLYQTRAVRRGKSAFTVNGQPATAAQYSAAWAKFTAAYPRKGANLPHRTFAAACKTAQLKNGFSQLSSRYKTHATAARVTLSKTSVKVGCGKTYALKASVAPASAIYEQYAWTTSNPAIVKVDGGVLTAVSPGNAVVSVQTTSGKKRSCKVTVTAPPATSVEISGDAHTVVLKQKLALSARVLPALASQTVKWSSANSAIASVSKAGVVTGKKMGTTTIRAATANGKTTTFRVTVLAEALNAQGAIIDLSRWNTVTDWKAVKKQVSFVILRCGVTYSAAHAQAGQMDIDARFDKYAKACLANGIPFGVYYYGMASTPEKARQEADKAYQVANKYNPLFYVYDAEEAVLNKASIEAFAARLRERGVGKVGCYIAHHRYSQYKVDTTKFDFIWIPHYGANTGEVVSTPSYACDLHQYSSQGKINGITGNVDLNRLMHTKPLSFFTS